MRSILNACIIITITSLASAQPPRYRMSDVGSLNGLSTLATALNEHGDVIGTSLLDTGAPHSEPLTHAFLYRDGVIVDLFDSYPAAVSIAMAINDDGAVAGYLAHDANGPRQPWWDGGSGPEILDPFGLGLLFAVTGSANGIDRLGQVVGSASKTMSINHAFLRLDSTSSIDLTPDASSPYMYTSATAVNDTGLVVGVLVRGFGLCDKSESFLHDGTSWIPLDDVLESQLGAQDFTPLAINDAGVVAGSACGASLSTTAVTYDGALFTLLATFGGSSSMAHGIDSAGRIVGEATHPIDGAPRAFLYEDGVAHDLNDLVAPSGMILASAHAINDHGQIVVRGHGDSDPYPPERWHSFLLTPLPPAESALEDLIDFIEGLGLPHGIENSLLVKLEHALADAAAGDAAGACDHVASFINHVNAQSGNKIASADAMELLERAATIQESLGCQ